MMVRVLKQARLLQYLLQFCANAVDTKLYVQSMGGLPLLCRKELCCRCRITVASVVGIVNNGSKMHVMERLCIVCSLCCFSTVLGQMRHSFARVFPGFKIKLI